MFFPFREEECRTSQGYSPITITPGPGETDHPEGLHHVWNHRGCSKPGPEEHGWHWRPERKSSQPFAHLPVFTPFHNSLPPHYSHSVVPLFFPTYYLRCDASISKLSADVSSGERQLIRLQQEVAELRSAVDVWLKELEVKVYRDMGRLEASLSEHSQGQRSSMSDLHTQVKLLESKMSDELKEAREQTDLLRKWTEQQINSSVQHCTQHHDKMLKATSALADRLHALEARVEQFETQLGRANRSQGDQLKRSETKLSKRMTSVESNLHQELQLLKQEYDKGFLSVHDAIESLRQISDIKSRLDKEKLQKDIRHICSKVTELNDL
uniref:Family with sequence similarity 81 member B n=1 Tax=Dicentrarchus labrax TaxID=13489 RepID=A0A8P4G763_DICLA